MIGQNQAALRKRLLKIAGESLDSFLAVLAEWFESPIEEKFFLGLACAVHDNPFLSLEVFPKGDEAWRASSALESPTFRGKTWPGLPVGFKRGEFVFRVYPQCLVGAYHGDFFIERIHDGYPGAIRVVVECDGHDFHERTKEQARHDRRRDRYMQSVGLPILRFTGSEISADPIGCGQQVLSFFQATEDRIRYGR